MAGVEGTPCVAARSEEVQTAVKETEVTKIVKDPKSSCDRAEIENVEVNKGTEDKQEDMECVIESNETETKADTMDDPSKGDTNKDTSKGDTKEDTSKGDTKDDQSIGDTNKDTSKGDKEDTSKGDTKEDTSKGDTKDDQAKGDTKEETSNGDTKEDTSKGDTKDDQPKGDTKEETSEGDTKGDTSKENTSKECAAKVEANSGDAKEAESSSSDGNLYGYIEKDFTSEIFKIEITNLPKYFGIKELKKQLLKLGLEPNKIKVSPDNKYAFVNFRCEQHRQMALEVCDGHQWKKQTWKVKVAKPAADPLLKKRKLETENEGDIKKRKNEDENLNVAERLQKVVTPLAHLSYDEQIEHKTKDLGKIIHRIGKNMSSVTLDNPKVMFEPLQLIRSPAEKDYRNKAEMTIGTSPDGEEKVVGFRLGSYKSGSVHVVSPSECVHIPAQMKNLAMVFQKYLQTVSKYPAFDPITRDGNWKQVMLRTTETFQCMVVPQFHPQSLSQEEIDAERQQMKEYFENGEGKDCKINSLYFQVQKDRGVPISTDVVLGDKNIVETMLGMKFRISPESFFQVNTRAAEVLYTKVGDLCGLDKETIVFDMCCGTGTIALSVAKRVKKVIGIEMVQEAIDDAKENAKLNEIENVEFICAKAEDPIFEERLLAIGSSTRIVVIVDPPRSGMHPSVIIRLRTFSHLISDVVYVSCNPTAAESNLIDLTRLKSRRVRGEPYLLKAVMGVDMFPSTNHTEAIFHFQKKERKEDKS